MKISRIVLALLGLAIIVIGIWAKLPPANVAPKNAAFPDQWHVISPQDSYEFSWTSGSTTIKCEYQLAKEKQKAGKESFPFPPHWQTQVLFTPPNRTTVKIPTPQQGVGKNTSVAGWATDPNGSVWLSWEIVSRNSYPPKVYTALQKISPYGEVIREVNLPGSQVTNPETEGLKWSFNSYTSINGAPLTSR